MKKNYWQNFDPNQLTWPVQYKFTYQAMLHDQMLYQLPEPKLVNNATVSGIQAMQSTQYEQATFYQNLMGQWQNQFAIQPPSPAKLPEQPKVDRVESTFHLLDSKNRLMCSGKYNTALKTEILSDRDSRTAVNYFHKHFCPDCQPHLHQYTAAA